MNPWHRHLFTLPLPVRANDLVRPALLGPKWKRSARLVKTREGKRWLLAAGAVLARVRRDLDNPQPLAGPVRVEVRFFLRSIASDADGRVKSLLDALTGYAWEDDRQVADLVVGKRIVELISDHPDAPLHERERAEVLVVDVSGEPEHEELEARLLEARARKRKAGKASKPKRPRLQPAEYR